jgi:hypothetical protein
MHKPLSSERLAQHAPASTGATGVSEADRPDRCQQTCCESAAGHIPAGADTVVAEQLRGGILYTRQQAAAAASH